MRKVAVLGLGRFGMRLAKELSAGGVEVIAVDRNGRLVDEVKDHVAVAVQMDICDEEALRSQEIDQVDVCVVAVGEGFEAALMTTLIVKNLGVVRVVARAQSQLQADILKRVGADEVIQPENHAACELARRLANPRLEDFITLDDQHGIVQWRVPGGFVGKSLGALRLRNRYRVNVLMIRRRLTEADGRVRQQTIPAPSADELLQANDVLVVIGEHAALAELPSD